MLIPSAWPLLDDREALLEECGANVKRQIPFQDLVVIARPQYPGVSHKVLKPEVYDSLHALLGHDQSLHRLIASVLEGVATFCARAYSL